MSIIDAVIIGLIIVGAIAGIAKGGITSLLSFIGVVIITYLAWVLRTPIAEKLIRFAPFFEFSGDIKGVTSLNILMYELIAFILVAGVLALILGIVLKITGAIEKVLKSTIILGLPSKIIGIISGALEAYVLIFIIICVLNNPFINLRVDGFVARWMMEKTPVISSLVDGTISSSSDIYNLINNRKKYSTDEMNFETLKILLEHEVVDPGSAYELVKKGKIKIPGAEDLIKKYYE